MNTQFYGMENQEFSSVNSCPQLPSIFQDEYDPLLNDLWRSPPTKFDPFLTTTSAESPQQSISDISPWLTNESPVILRQNPSLRQSPAVYNVDINPTVEEIKTMPIPQSLNGLLESTTIQVCSKILQEPVKRKPGRKSKSDRVILGRTSNLECGDQEDDRKRKNKEAAEESRRRVRERTDKLEILAGRLKLENVSLKAFIHELEQQINYGMSVPQPDYQG